MGERKEEGSLFIKHLLCARYSVRLGGEQETRVR